MVNPTIGPARSQPNFGVPLVTARRWGYLLPVIPPLSSFLLMTVLTWPQAEVAYRFDASVSADHRVLVERALGLWQRPGGPVRFRRVESSWWAEAGWALGWDRSVVVREDGRLPVFARTTLGAGPHRELVFNPALSSPEWITADLAHEWGHVLGLTHEHQRPDRDRYVALPPGFLDGLPAYRVPDYALEAERPGAPPLGPYDYASLMHYSSNIDGNRMVRRDTGALIPGAQGPSEGDWRRLQSLYPLTQESP